MTGAKASLGPPPVVYVAGPFRAESPWRAEENVRKAEQWALDIARAGGVPLCPHAMYRHYEGALPDGAWLDYTRRLLLRCDAAWFCPGWTRSEGSRAEHELAERVGIPAFVPETSTFDGLVRWIDARRERLAALRPRLREIRRRLCAATFAHPEPWGYDPGMHGGHVTFDADGLGAIWPVACRPETGEPAGEWENVGRFVAHAPTDIEYLLARLDDDGQEGEADR